MSTGLFTSFAKRSRISERSLKSRNHEALPNQAWMTWRISAQRFPLHEKLMCVLCRAKYCSKNLVYLLNGTADECIHVNSCYTLQDCSAPPRHGVSNKEFHENRIVILLTVAWLQISSAFSSGIPFQALRQMYLSRGTNAYLAASIPKSCVREFCQARFARYGFTEPCRA